MFTKKQQTADIVKKSSAKVTDQKKEVFARLKHLKTILGESSRVDCHLKVLKVDKQQSFKRELMENRILHNFWGRHQVVSLWSVVH